MSSQHELFVLSFTFATGTPHMRGIVAHESDNGRLVGPGYPLNFHGMSRGRLDQYTLVNTVRKNAQSLAAVLVCRKQDVAKQSQRFYRRVEKTLARLKVKAQRIAELKKQGNVRRVMVFDPLHGWVNRDVLDVKKGERFYWIEPDGARVDNLDWTAQSNGFWSKGYIAAVRVEPA